MIDSKYSDPSATLTRRRPLIPGSAYEEKLVLTFAGSNVPVPTTSRRVDTGIPAGSCEISVI